MSNLPSVTLIMSDEFSMLYTLQLKVPEIMLVEEVTSTRLIRIFQLFDEERYFFQSGEINIICLLFGPSSSNKQLD